MFEKEIYYIQLCFIRFIRFIYWKIKWWIEILCKLQKTERYYQKKSLFYFINWRGFNKNTRLQISHTIEYHSCFQQIINAFR